MRSENELLDHLLHLVAAGAGSPRGRVADRLQRLVNGLSAEDEFAATLSWLGKARLVHKLDQFMVPPGARATYRVPDLLAVFGTEQGDVAALIEVKSSKKQELRWRSDYREALLAYGNVVGLPVLVAWKVTAIQAWVLVDVRDFTQAVSNWRMTLKDALKNNLMGALAGDVAVVFKKGVGLHIVMAKEKLLRRRRTSEGNVEEWVLRIEDAFFTDGSGARFSDEMPDLQSLFLSAPFQAVEEHTSERITQRFVVTGEDEFVWAHQALSSLLFFGSSGDQPQWRRTLILDALPLPYSRWLKAADMGLKHNIVRYIINQEPAHLPSWLNSPVHGLP